MEVVSQFLQNILLFMHIFVVNNFNWNIHYEYRKSSFYSIDLIAHPVLYISFF